jgi:hypothetical protein
VPDEYVDSLQLIGPPAQIMQRWPAWRDSGLTSLHITRATPEIVELFGKALRSGGQERKEEDWTRNCC